MSVCKGWWRRWGGGGGRLGKLSLHRTIKLLCQILDQQFEIFWVSFIYVLFVFLVLSMYRILGCSFESIFGFRIICVYVILVRVYCLRARKNGIKGFIYTSERIILHMCLYINHDPTVHFTALYSDHRTYGCYSYTNNLPL